MTVNGTTVGTLTAVASRHYFRAEQLSPSLRLIHGADRVDVKLSLPGSGHRSVIEALDLDLRDVGGKASAFSGPVYPSCQRNLVQQSAAARRRDGRRHRCCRRDRREHTWAYNTRGSRLNATQAAGAALDTGAITY
jgi:hypothetical protein